MKDKPYRIFYCGITDQSFEILVPNSFANYQYVKVKAISVGMDMLPYNVYLLCDQHYHDAIYGDGIYDFNDKTEFNKCMFNLSSLVYGKESSYAYLPYRNKYTFSFKDISGEYNSMGITLILELEPINFN